MLCNFWFYKWCNDQTVGRFYFLKFNSIDIKENVTSDVYFHVIIIMINLRIEFYEFMYQYHTILFKVIMFFQKFYLLNSTVFII